jgi:hypothetical protein
MRLIHFSESCKEVTILLIAGFLVMGTAACSDESTGVQMSSVRVLLTDAPSDVIASAEVWISRVYLQSGDDEETESGRVDLFNDPDNPQHYDLLTLRNGVTADLTDVVNVAVGLYGSLRLVVDSARVTLVEGVSFEDETDTATLFVPSGSTSGIKVLLDRDLEAVEGEVTTVTVDFDVDQNFVIEGSQGPGGVRSVIFTPLLREHARYQS